MEGCLNTEKDVDKVLSKFNQYKSNFESSLQQLEDQMVKLRSELQQLPPDEPIDNHHAVLMQFHKKVKSTGQKLSSSHKELHGSVSRVGKTIDKNFDADCSAALPTQFYSDAQNDKLLNQAICEHYYREGQGEVAGYITQEGHLQIDCAWKEPFILMNQVLESLKKRNINPALEWVERNHLQLQEKESDLEFLLHRLKFIDLMKKGPEAQTEALQYSRKFQPFAGKHSKEIQMLMGSFLYLRNGLGNSPYSSLLDEQNWDEICNIFARDACGVLGLPVDSPLLVGFNVGCKALPSLIAIKSVIEQRQCAGVLSDKDELPIDINLSPPRQYHSVFACPILRQQTTENNPPMRLTCGHVISYDALDKLISGAKVKCPYCPMVQSPEDTKRVYF